MFVLLVDIGFIMILRVCVCACVCVWGGHAVNTPDLC